MQRYARPWALPASPQPWVWVQTWTESAQAWEAPVSAPPSAPLASHLQPPQRVSQRRRGHRPARLRWQWVPRLRCPSRRPGPRHGKEPLSAHSKHISRSRPTIIFARIPSSCASTSMVALSVSYDARVVNSAKQTRSDMCARFPEGHRPQRRTRPPSSSKTRYRPPSSSDSWQACQISRGHSAVRRRAGLTRGVSK